MGQRNVYHANVELSVHTLADDTYISRTANEGMKKIQKAICMADRDWHRDWSFRELGNELS